MEDMSSVEYMFNMTNCFVSFLNSKKHFTEIFIIPTLKFVFKNSLSQFFQA